ncbi:hypothetical protein CNR22_19375 [Sphingobacteriaceae bacterium]|nr:hypothetical protein CNR22_19375 [Sphingobacteriaceae bacterium]
MNTQVENMINCKICNSTTDKFYSTTVLQKYEADYYKCSSCGFIQTSEPVWIKEAYSSAITSLDIGLIQRNLELKVQVANIIDRVFADSTVMIDYGGGYGLFVRMMRDLGYNFYRQDIYCENLFAKCFDLEDLPAKTKFDLLTTFEVFEHLINPVEEIAKMLTLSETLIFSTVLAPDTTADFKTWWYVSPLTGQHVAFYSFRTLEFLAKKFNKQLYSNGVNLHILTAKVIDKTTLDAVFSGEKKSFSEKLIRRIFNKPVQEAKKQSLLPQDYAFIEKKLLSKS